MRRLTILSICVLATSCNGSTGTSRPITGDCSGRQAHIEALYDSDLPKADDNANAKTKRRQMIVDNRDMVLKDCRQDPRRFIPCIDGARSVAELETKCVLPLDDDGRVEERQFHPRD